MSLAADEARARRARRTVPARWQRGRRRCPRRPTTGRPSSAAAVAPTRSPGSSTSRQAPRSSSAGGSKDNNDTDPVALDERQRARQGRPPRRLRRAVRRRHVLRRRSLRQQRRQRDRVLVLPGAGQRRSRTAGSRRVHTVGDLFVVSHFENGGAAAQIVLFRMGRVRRLGRPPRPARCGRTSVPIRPSRTGLAGLQTPSATAAPVALHAQVGSSGLIPGRQLLRGRRRPPRRSLAAMRRASRAFLIETRDVGVRQLPRSRTSSRATSTPARPPTITTDDSRSTPLDFGQQSHGHREHISGDLRRRRRPCPASSSSAPRPKTGDPGCPEGVGTQVNPAEMSPHRGPAWRSSRGRTRESA